MFRNMIRLELIIKCIFAHLHVMDHFRRLRITCQTLNCTSSEISICTFISWCTIFVVLLTEGKLETFVKRNLCCCTNVTMCWKYAGDRTNPQQIVDYYRWSLTTIGHYVNSPQVQNPPSKVTLSIENPFTRAIQDPVELFLLEFQYDIVRFIRRRQRFLFSCRVYNRTKSEKTDGKAATKKDRKYNTTTGKMASLR